MADIREDDDGGVPLTAEMIADAVRTLDSAIREKMKRDDDAIREGDPALYAVLQEYRRLIHKLGD